MSASKRNETFPDEPEAAGRLRDALGHLPLAELGPEGRVDYVNEAGLLHWGRILGLQVPEDILVHLGDSGSTSLAPLPVSFGGMRVLGVPAGEGWVLIGFADREAGGGAEGFAEDAPVALARVQKNGTPRYVNREFERLTGYTRDDDFASWLEVVHPEDRHRITAALRSPDRTVVSFRFQRGDGAMRRGEVHLQPSATGDLHAVLLDVTEQDEVEAALMQNEALYQIFLEQSPVGVLHVDRERVVTFENHRLRMMTGEEAEDAWIGRPLGEIEGIEERLCELVGEMLEGGRPFDEADFLFVRRDGERCYLRIHGAPIRHPERGIVGAALMLFDTTSEREREEELRVFRRYDEVEPALRNAALSLASTHAFLDEAARLIGETAQADQVFVLLPDEDADAYAEEIRWTREPERSLVPLCLDVEAWPNLTPGRILYAREDLTTPEAHALLEAIGGHEAVALPFVTESEKVGLLLLGRTGERPERWTPVERRALGRLGALFETLWSWLRAEARYRQVVTTVEDGLFSLGFGPDGVREYSFATRQVEALTGYAADALLSGAVSWRADVVHEEDRAAVEEHDRQLRDGRESRLIYRVRRRDGAVRWLRESATPSRNRAGRLVVAGVLSDVTEAKEAEADLVQAKQDAEAANRMKSTFLATMSHEIRTPLGAINGFAELLEEEVGALGEVPPEVTEFTDAIRTSARKVLRLVNDLFDLSSLQTGRLAVDRAPVPFHPIVSRIAAEDEPKFSGKGLTLDLDLAAGEPIVLGDAQRIEQVLRQLVSNALKFTEEGGVRITSTLEPSEVRLTVEDTGVGIGADYLPELFVPFSQEDNRLNRDYAGSGLGLAIVKRLVEAMDGRIEGESTKGEGTRFTLTLPRADG